MEIRELGPDDEALRYKLDKLFEKKEVIAQPHEKVVAQYQLFQAATNAKTDIVYHPCSGADMSPSIAFPKSRIVYVELDPLCVAALKKKGCTAIEASALTYNPGPIDVLILVNPYVKPDFPSQWVIPGGYVLCNDHHQTATLLHTDTDFQFQGIITPTNETESVFDRNDLNDCWQRVAKDEEWQAARAGLGEISYIEAKDIVQTTGNLSKNIFSAYQNILQIARNQAVLENTDPNAEPLIFMYNNEPFILPTKLPRCKGHIDDLFVFQKK